ncbi:MAG: glycosyltransferase family 87 protein [Planctomycetota bacterium]|nr:glycosyltransferase family 87 protein [Planctomycetota bacterium]MDA1180179.1 glycosyltransferase family 87 protein [Planctomycetota bacterium]
MDLRPTGSVELAHRARWARRGLVLVLLALLLPFVRHRSELPVYVKAASRYLVGEQFYRSDDPPSFAYPPFLVLPFTALAPFDGYPLAVLWWLANLSLGLISIDAITKLVRPTVVRGVAQGKPPAWIPCVVIGILGGRFAVSPLEYQSNDLIVLCLFLATLTAMAMGVTTRLGLWGGLATACKATPLLLLPVLLWQRQFTAAVYFCITLVLATLVPDLLVRNPHQELWVMTWYHQFVSKVEIAQSPAAEGAWIRWNPLNQSLAGTIYRLSTPIPDDGERINVAVVHLSPRQQQHCTLLVQLAVLVVLAWATRLLTTIAHTIDRSRTLLGQGGCILCAMLLLSPMSSTQHFVALVVPITYLVIAFLYGSRSLWLGVVLGVFFLLGPLGAQDIVGSFWADHLQAYGGTTLFTLIAFFASSLALSSERKQAAKDLVAALGNPQTPISHR